MRFADGVKDVVVSLGAGGATAAVGMGAQVAQASGPTMTLVFSIVVTLVSFLLRRELSRILAAVDRIPSREWFDMAGDLMADHTRRIGKLEEREEGE